MQNAWIILGKYFNVKLITRNCSRRFVEKLAGQARQADWSNEFDPRAIPWSRGERRITSQQWCPKRFGEGDVSSVVRGDIMT